MENVFALVVLVLVVFAVVTHVVVTIKVINGVFDVIESVVTIFSTVEEVVEKQPVTMGYVGVSAQYMEEDQPLVIGYLGVSDDHQCKLRPVMGYIGVSDEYMVRQQQQEQLYAAIVKEENERLMEFLYANYHRLPTAIGSRKSAHVSTEDMVTIGCPYKAVRSGSKRKNSRISKKGKINKKRAHRSKWAQETAHIEQLRKA